MITIKETNQEKLKSYKTKKQKHENEMKIKYALFFFSFLHNIKHNVLHQIISRYQKKQKTMVWNGQQMLKLSKAFN